MRQELFYQIIVTVQHCTALHSPVMWMVQQTRKSNPVISTILFLTANTYLVSGTYIYITYTSYMLIKRRSYLICQKKSRHFSGELNGIMVKMKWDGNSDVNYIWWHDEGNCSQQRKFTGWLWIWQHCTLSSQPFKSP